MEMRRRRSVRERVPMSREPPSPISGSLGHRLAQTGTGTRPSQYAITPLSIHSPALRLSRRLLAHSIILTFHNGHNSTDISQTLKRYPALIHIPHSATQQPGSCLPYLSNTIHVRLSITAPNQQIRLQSSDMSQNHDRTSQLHARPSPSSPHAY